MDVDKQEKGQIMNKRGKIARAVSFAAASTVASLVVLAATPASAATSYHRSHHHHRHSYRLARCTARGRYAICDASGTTRSNPHSIRVHVKSSHPGEQVYVSWDVTCAKGYGAGSRTGSKMAITTLNKKIKHPYKHPDNCIVSAGAQLQNGGSWVEVYITYRT
jgi:hypothetical protein